MKKLITNLGFLLIALVIVSVNLISSNDNQKSLLSNNKPTAITDFKPYTDALLVDTLPKDFPKIVIDSLNNPAPGSIFMESFTIAGTTANYLMILDNQGKVTYFKKPSDQSLYFKMQQNGQFTYCTKVKLGDQYQAGPLKVQNIMVKQNILDSNYNIIDTVQMKNDYLADIHDFLILPNGNYLLIAYENVPIDMSKLIPNGNPNAIVVGTVIQELDQNKNCVFQWRSLDYIPVLSTKDDPRKATFEHVHGNSLFLDKDGNLIISFPTTFEIVKIDMVSGKMIWRFGGDKNEFAITGDDTLNKPYYFTMQHDVKRLPNGNILFYDNAVANKAGWNSRAVEYEFDELNKKANLVWEYKRTPKIGAYAMGSAQRLANGNTLIDWGLIFAGTYRTMTEVTPDKKIAFEMSLPSDAFSYRAHKYELPACQAVANVDKYEMLEGNTYKFNDSKGQTGVEIYIEKLDGFVYNMMNVKKYDCPPINEKFEAEAPVVLPGRYVLTPQFINSFAGEVRFDVASLPGHLSPENLNVYYRAKSDSGVFKKLPTNYNITEKQIIATSKEFGEYIVGFVRKSTEIMSPKLMYPANNQFLINDKTIKFVWSPTGRYDSFKMQIAEDTLFNKIVQDINYLRDPQISNVNLDPNKKYFWRTQTVYRELISPWSQIRSFTLSEPFISVLFPNGGETLTKDSTYVFRWKSNLSDSVSITLLRNGEKEAMIKDGIYSFSNSFAWKIPLTVTEDVTYTILVKDLKDTTLKAQSASSFKISKPVGVEENPELIENDFKLFPNPSNDNVNIEFKVANGNNIRLELVDQLGTTKQLIIDSYLPEGIYKFNLNLLNHLPGIYFCKFSDGNHSIVKKLNIIR